jgi:hypothetical protein
MNLRSARRHFKGVRKENCLVEDFVKGGAYEHVEKAAARPDFSNAYSPKTAVRLTS